MFYWFLKWIAIGPVLRIVFRPQVEGVHNVPDSGPAILASNHLSYADWLFMPLTLTRRVTFVAKAEYFTTPGIKGWFQKLFFSGAGQVPIDRGGADAAAGALMSAKRVLGEGGVGPRVLLPRVRVGVQDAFCSGPSSACSRAAFSRSAFSRSAFSRSACLAFSLSSSFALLA